MEVVDLLIAAGAKLNPTDAQVNPLLFAVSRRYVPMIEPLLSRGADVNWKNSQGQTPLMAAELGGSPEVVRLLIAKGADLNAKDSSGRTALSVAEELSGEFKQPEQSEIVQILKAAEARQ
jgi:ankyrin repeat protein